MLGFARRAPQANVPQPNLGIKIFLIGVSFLKTIAGKGYIH
jgi:hypothetical protein